MKPSLGDQTCVVPAHRLSLSFKNWIISATAIGIFGEDDSVAGNHHGAGVSLLRPAWNHCWHGLIAGDTSTGESRYCVQAAVAVAPELSPLTLQLRDGLTLFSCVRCCRLGNGARDRNVIARDCRTEVGSLGLASRRLIWGICDEPVSCQYYKGNELVAQVQHVWMYVRMAFKYPQRYSRHSATVRARPLDLEPRRPFEIWRRSPVKRGEC